MYEWLKHHTRMADTGIEGDTGYFGCGERA